MRVVSCALWSSIGGIKGGLACLLACLLAALGSEAELKIKFGAFWQLGVLGEQA
jgi:hypothetical protein